MRRLICCEYHEDSQTVELRYTDGMLIDIDCMAVEDEVARNMYERSELDYLLNHDPVGYVDLILNGDVVAYYKDSSARTEELRAIRSAVGRAHGKFGDIVVEVVADESTIYQVNILEQSETPGIGSLAVETLPNNIVEANTIAVDGVAAATVSSNAIKAAVADALSMMGLDPSLGQRFPAQRSIQPFGKRSWQWALIRTVINRSTDQTPKHRNYNSKDKGDRMSEQNRPGSKGFIAVDPYNRGSIVEIPLESNKS